MITYEREGLSPAVFDIDADRVASRISQFIGEAMARLGRQGIAVALSGGLDSSTVLALGVQAVGAERVTALLLPDRKGSPEALAFGRLVADRLSVKVVEIDTTRLNRAAGVYRFIGYRLPKRLVERIARSKISKNGENAFIVGLRGGGDRLTRQALAMMYARQRLRMVVTYRYADLRRLLVVGSAHKSEDLLGLFVKFGVDDVADVMPLKGLYRSHVVQIAGAVGVPDEVIARTPNPEMLPGIHDKYLDVLGVSAPAADLVLWGIEHGMDDDEIATDTTVPTEKVAEVRSVVALSEHMRTPSMFPDLAPSGVPESSGLKPEG